MLTLASKILKLFRSHNIQKEAKLIMFTRNKYQRTCWQIHLAVISLFFFQTGCATAPPSPTALHYDVTCSPTDARSQLRQYFSTQRIRTSEAAPDDKSFAITTELMSEPRSENTDKQIAYKLEVKPSDNANSSTINLSRVDIKTKGVRERDWRDDDSRGNSPQSEEQLAKAIQSICRSGQQ